MALTMEQRTIRKVSWRLLPLIVIIYFVAYIDRTNVSFAAWTMNKELGLSVYVFGWGAGIFFLGYFLFHPGEGRGADLDRPLDRAVGCTARYDTRRYLDWGATFVAAATSACSVPPARPCATGSRSRLQRVSEPA